MGLVAALPVLEILGSVELLPVALANAQGRCLFRGDGPLQQRPWKDMQTKPPQRVAKAILGAYALVEPAVGWHHWA